MSNKLEQIISAAPDSVKHVADGLMIPGGIASAIAWISDVINPLLSMTVLVLTIIWTYYRIKEMRNKDSKK